MLIQLLDYLQSGKTYSIQDLAGLLNKDTESVRVELEYLEHQGYIRKVIGQADCNHNCKGHVPFTQDDMVYEPYV